MAYLLTGLLFFITARAINRCFIFSGLYDKDYLKKLGLDSKDEGSGEVEGSYESGLPKEIGKGSQKNNF